MKLTKRETALIVVFLFLGAILMLYTFIKKEINRQLHPPKTSNPPSILEKANWHDGFVKSFFVVGNQFDYFCSENESTNTVKVIIPEYKTYRYCERYEMVFYDSTEEFRQKGILFYNDGPVTIGVINSLESSTDIGSNWLCLQYDTMIDSGRWPQPVIPKVPIKHDSWATLDEGPGLPYNPFDVYVKGIVQLQYPSNKIVPVVEFRIERGSPNSANALREWWSPDLGLMAFNDLEGQIYTRILDGEKVESTTIQKE